MVDESQAREPEAPVALYRLEVKVVSRGKQGASMVAGAAYRSGSCLVEHDHGRSAVAASAHLAGVALEDERGVVHDFRGKAVICSEIMLPPGARSLSSTARPWSAATSNVRPSSTGSPASTSARPSPRWSGRASRRT